MNRSRAIGHDWVRHVCVAHVIWVLCLPMSVRGQLATSADAVSTPDRVHPDRLYPDYRKGHEITLSSVGAGFLVASLLVPVDYRDVPPPGFDPIEIAWSMDRDIIGNKSLQADATSDWTLNAAVAFPLVLTFVTSQHGERWRNFGRRSLVYAETFLIRQGFTSLAKTMLGRARPYAYLSEEGRPDDSAYDVSRESTFQSMPSGHSSTAWTGAALGMTEHLLNRPEASWLERAGVGFVGGALAGMTSALRVEAGLHFPSDVLAGAGIGIATGVAVPLLHRGEQPLPSSKAWAEMMAGALAGTLLGVLVAQGY